MEDINGNEYSRQFQQFPYSTVASLQIMMRIVFMRSPISKPRSVTLKNSCWVLCTINRTCVSEKCCKSYFQNRNPLLPAEWLVTNDRTDNFSIYNYVSGNLVSVLWEVKFSLLEKLSDSDYCCCYCCCFCFCCYLN